jgi:RNA polymerase sigma-70 factor (ECF subfamily)
VNEPDPAVIRAAQDGDLRAYDELVRDCYVRVLRYLRHFLGDRTLAEDVTQETFVRCFRRLDTYNFEGRFTTWLVQIARNAGIDALRRRQRHERLALLAPGPGPMHDAVARVEIDAALGALPARLRDALVLVEVVGLRYREAAALLDVPEGTVKSRVSKARSRLVDWFGARDGEPDEPDEPDGRGGVGGAAGAGDALR